MLPCDPELQKVTGGYNPAKRWEPRRRPLGRDLGAPPEVNVAAPGCGLPRGSPPGGRLPCRPHVTPGVAAYSGRSPKSPLGPQSERMPQIGFKSGSSALRVRHPRAPGVKLLRVETTACGTLGGRRASCTFEQSDHSDGWRLTVFRHTGPKSRGPSLMSRKKKKKVMENPDFSDGPLQRAQTRTPPHALAGVRARPQGPSEAWLAMCQTAASAGRPRHVPAEPRAGPRREGKSAGSREPRGSTYLTPKQYGGQQGTAQDILCIRDGKPNFD
eukprot:XP_022279494.1 uncharacterized protein LOC102154410 [Canis lupus familiaris]